MRPQSASIVVGRTWRVPLEWPPAGVTHFGFRRRLGGEPAPSSAH